MIFRIDYTRGDTCGNEWAEGEPEYLEENSLEEAWKKLKKPAVSGYWIEKKYIFFSRTPNGEGYGIWEDNPEFNFKKDIKIATGFKSGGFVGIKVQSIRIKK